MAGLLALLNPTALLAIAAAFGIGYTSGHWEGGASARNQCVTRRLEAENQALANRFDTLTAAAEAHTKRLAADTRADNENRSRVDATSANTAACLSRAAAGRVRNVH
ncbi:hypothetical protein [Azorhizobium doebereinerae]|uniref:hypothetical protein n=1 Tax=Azorhizobium doebereinerae TaxID=281091 RepID=UPI00042598A2|nr:hypothetical protein [Azorhizobium doebereinerae]